ncbi:hypothetical protein TNCT_353301 [Trichonephila clavata]|uniref:Uncharacterized protein n=1 Tax=Trichonephila clavata TaxID=2740835 RepID=A0A8X6IGN1_TRICU|nr:hypothetical protein TNCT_353301 [Trichonephila clavata]
MSSTDESDVVSVSLKASLFFVLGEWYHDRYPFHTRLNRRSTANCVLDPENRDRPFHHPIHHTSSSHSSNFFPFLH